MWLLLFRTLRVYAPYITLPVAGVIGIIGYNFESFLSDKYTPYSESIKEKRNERLMTEESLTSATNKRKLEYNKNVLNTNIAPSLQK